MTPGATQRTFGRRSGPSLLGVLMSMSPAFGVAMLFAAVGILHVTSRVWVVDAGYQLSRLEQENSELQREHDRLRLELATLKGPARLEKVAREVAQMGPPAPTAVITVRTSAGTDLGVRAKRRSQNQGAREVAQVTERSSL